MNNDLVGGKRHEQKGILKQKLATLTENDTLPAESKKEERPGKLQIKPGRTKI